VLYVSGVGNRKVSYFSVYQIPVVAGYTTLDLLKLGRRERQVVDPNARATSLLPKKKHYRPQGEFTQIAVYRAPLLVICP